MILNELFLFANVLLVFVDCNEILDHWNTVVGKSIIETI